MKFAMIVLGLAIVGPRTQTAAPPSPCGDRGGLALGTINGLQYKLSTQEPSASLVDGLREVPQDSIVVVRDEALCSALIGREEELVDPADPSPPLAGVIRTGGIGYFVVRQEDLSGPGGHGVTTMAFFDPQHVLRSRTVIRS